MTTSVPLGTVGYVMVGVFDLSWAISTAVYKWKYVEKAATRIDSIYSLASFAPFQTGAGYYRVPCTLCISACDELYKRATRQRASTHQARQTTHRRKAVAFPRRAIRTTLMLARWFPVMNF
jgi:hypothetical protein